MSDSPREPGWYPDPWGAAGEQRYFDGDAWQRNESPVAEQRRSGRRRGRAWFPVLVVVGVAAVALATTSGWLTSGSSTPAAGHRLTPTIGRKKSLGPQDGVRINSRSYGRGDCVTWPQDGRPLVDSDVVDCAMPHLFEIVGPVRLTGMTGAFPTPQAWRLIASSRCGPVVDRYLGGPIDPYGKFYAGAIEPLAAGWVLGERVIWCGIGATGPNVASRSLHPPMRGRVHAQEQERVVVPGTCVGGPSASDGTEVACALPHLFEVTGTIDLGSRGLNSPTLDETRQATESGCSLVATAYLGGALPSGLVSDSLGLPPESWAAGGRLVECVIGQTSGAGWVPVAGSHKASQ